MDTAERRWSVRVASVADAARHVKTLNLHACEGVLPPFTAGAHITVHLEGGRDRQYSLCGDPEDAAQYVIAVLRERHGRGGSAYMHDVVRPGAKLLISGPRNHFQLDAGARRYLLIAGGIGITPVLPMVRELRRRPVEFTLHYCARTPEDAAFLNDLKNLCRPHQLVVHCDGGDPRAGLDAMRLLATPEPGTEIYCCGPRSLMDAVRTAASAWSPRALHFESFGVADSAPTGEFTVTLGRSGRRFGVPSSKSIVQVLREHGVDIETSCEAGTCGTCKTRFIAGDPIHNDFFLTPLEQKEFVMPCCSRAKSLLELDL